MKKLIFISLLLISFSAIAQIILWPNEPINTGANSSYFLSADTDVTFDGEPFIYGKLGAFYTDDNGDLQNGGWMLWNNTPSQIAVWADDIFTTQKDGFYSGEEITWLASDDGGTTTYYASVAFTMGPTGMGSSNFTQNGINILSEFTISNTVYNAGITIIFGCTDPTAYNFDPTATIDNGSCELDTYGCTNPDADNYDSEANTDNGSCIVSGCTNEEADNYNENANNEDGSCIISGCTDPDACNFNSAATDYNGSCSYPDAGYDCAGDCLNDINSDEICDAFQVGCTDLEACNYDSNALFDDGSCGDIYSTGNLGDLIYIPDGSGVSYQSTVNIQAFDSEATLDDDDFEEICIEIEHSYLGDLQLELESPSGSSVMLHSYGSGGGSTWLGNPIDNDLTENSGDCWEYCWSTEPEFSTFGNSLGNTIIAPNGDPSMAPGSYTPEGDFSDFQGSSANGVWTLTITDNFSIDNGFICAWGLDIRNNSHCNEIPLIGCNDPNACNYQDNSFVDNSNCEYLTSYLYEQAYGNGIPLFDASGNPIMEYQLISSPELNCNENCYEYSLDENGTPLYNEVGEHIMQYVQNSTDDCSDVILGCTNSNACNYIENATVNDGSCEYASIETYYHEHINGAGNQVHPNSFGAVPVYNPDGTPSVVFSSLPDPSVQCQEIPIYGCTDNASCNYNPNATIEDGSCINPEIYYNCDETCINDSDGDGVCNELEIIGCTDPSAFNYNPNASDYGTCLYEDSSCEQSQWFLPFDGVTGTNMTLLLQESFVSSMNLQSDNAYIIAASESGLLVGSTFVNNVQTSIVIWGDDSFTTEIDGATDGQLINLYLIDGNQLYDINVSFNYITNNLDVFSDEVSPVLVCIAENLGCTDNASCNYNSDATIEDGSCINPAAYYNCDETCINDIDSDGICDELEVPGCTDLSALNYNFNATDDDGSCTYEISGCTYPDALNYNETATIDDGSCIFEFNVSFEDVINVTNIISIYNIHSVNITLGTDQIALGDLLGAFYLIDGVLVCGGYVVYDGSNMVDITLVGDDPSTQEIEGFQEGQEIIWIVQQSETEINYLIDVISESDGFVPNTEEDVTFDEVSPSATLGCTDLTACNYNEDANLEDGTCVYQDQFEDCDGNCINDTDLDEVCDEEDNCIGLVNPNQEDSDNNGVGDACDYNDGIGIDEISEDIQTLIKIIDVLGREQKEHKRGTLLFYIYDNGKVEKKVSD